MSLPRGVKLTRKTRVEKINKPPTDFSQPTKMDEYDFTDRHVGEIVVTDFDRFTHTLNKKLIKVSRT